MLPYVSFNFQVYTNCLFLANLAPNCLALRPSIAELTLLYLSQMMDYTSLYQYTPKLGLGGMPFFLSQRRILVFFYLTKHTFISLVICQHLNKHFFFSLLFLCSWNQRSIHADICSGCIMPIYLSEKLFGPWCVTRRLWGFWLLSDPL